MPSVEAVKLKKGDFIEYQGSVWAIIDTDFYNPGKGSALMKVKVRNPESGKVIDHTYKSNEKIEQMEVTGADMQFLYRENDTLFFMDDKTYEQYEVPTDVAGESAKFLKDGNSYYLYIHDGQPLDINMGASVGLKVVQAEEVVKGNTSTNVKKEVTLETGAKIMVPPFIKTGDIVSINPESGEYRSRVNE